MTVAFILFWAIGLFLVYLGCLIWKKKKLHLIAGYNQDIFKGDREKLAKLFGKYSISVGVLTTILPFGLAYVGNVAGVMFMAVVVPSTIMLSFYTVWQQMKG